MLLERLVNRCKEVVSEKLNADDEPKLVKIIRLMRWMEQMVATRRKVPTLEAIGYATFSLNEYTDESDVSQ